VDRSATIEPTPTPMQMKKKSRRFHEDRISRTAMFITNFIAV
jgi:hypothetical protein